MQQTKLARVLKERKLIPQDLIRMSRVGESTIRQSVRGLRTPSKKNAEKIAKALGLKVSDLFTV